MIGGDCIVFVGLEADDIVWCAIEVAAEFLQSVEVDFADSVFGDLGGISGGIAQA